MRYYKVILNDYINGVGTGVGGLEITETEYSEILSVIQNKPATTETTDYRLKTDLTWESYALEEPQPTEEDKADAYDILMGVET